MKVRTLFTDRWGGVSAAPYDTFNLAYHVGDVPEAVAANRRTLRRRYQTPPVVWMEQVHGDTIRRIDRADQETPPSCDGLVTDRDDVALAVMVADCLPILMYDPVIGVVAAVHAGRNGTLLDIGVKALLRMEAWYGTRAEDVRVFVGPAIGPCCYEVDEKIAAIVAATYGKAYTRGRYIDLKGINRDRLLQSGVKPEHIQISSICTCCDDNYFSYRREKKTGRFAGVIWLERS